LALLHQIATAIEWNASVETNVYHELTEQITVWDRIKEYQTDIDTKIPLLVQSDQSEREKIMEHLKKLESKILQDLHEVSHDPTVKESLESLLLCIYSANSSHLQIANGKSKINYFESEIYFMVEKIYKLTVDMTEEEHYGMKQELGSLGKEIAAYRSQLEKEIISGENVEENKAMVDHLEDLQENLADLEYMFSGKVDVLSKSTFLERAQEKMGGKKYGGKYNKVDKLFEL